jgi:uncharacterized protein YukE
MPLSSKAEPRSTELQTSFQNLSVASKMLNDASDAFGEAATALDEALNDLNPGVTTWVTVGSSSDENTPWETEEERLGYAKTSGRWGLTLCTVTCDERGDGSEEIAAGPWLFNDAPRSLRLRAIDYVPELIEALANEVAQTAKRVAEKTSTAQQLAASISGLARKGKQ